MASPKPNLEMDFPTALQEIIAGGRITKKEWNNPDIYLALRDGKLVIRKSDGFHPLIVTDGDLMGKDWIIIHNQPVN